MVSLPTLGKQEPLPLLYNPLFKCHRVGEDCPETPERLEEILEDIGVNYLQVNENGESYLSLIHEEAYIEEIQRKCQELAPEETVLAREDDLDTWLCDQSFAVASRAAGAAVQAAASSKKAQTMFSLNRPPGHHAFPAQSRGFCIFNNMAIAAEYLRQQSEPL